MKDLRVAGVAKAFGPQPVLRGVDLAVPHGSFTAILGASGSGKTTLLRIVAGFERPDDGVVQLGEEVVDDAGHRFVPSERRRIGYVPQEGALFPHLSVGRNVGFGLPRGPDRRRRVDELLELVGLSGYRRRYPHQLSGGSSNGSHWRGLWPSSPRSSSSTSPSRRWTPPCAPPSVGTCSECCARPGRPPSS